MPADSSPGYEPKVGRIQAVQFHRQALHPLKASYHGLQSETPGLVIAEARAPACSGPREGCYGLTGKGNQTRIWSASV